MFRTGFVAVSLLIAGCASQGNARSAAVKWAAEREPDVCRFVPGPELQAIAPQEIAAVEPLYTTFHEATGTEKRLLGAKLLVRSSPGLTAESLDRAVECHVARRILANAPATTDDPFTLGDEPLEIGVKPAGAGFEVDIVAPSVAEARDVLARANAYAHVYTRASARN